MNKIDLMKFRNQIQSQVVTKFSVKRNVINLNTHNSWLHESIKCRIAYELQKLGKHYITEVDVKKINQRQNKIDILNLDDAQGIEVMVSETEDQLVRKVAKCPDCIEIVGVTKWEDLFNGRYKVIKQRLI